MRSIGSSSKTTIADDRLRRAADGFNVFIAKLKKLNIAVKAYHKDLVQAQSSRSNLVGALGDLASNSPVSSLMRTDMEQPEDTITPYANSHNAKVNAVLSTLGRYQDEIITYVDEWEKTVSTRISTELKHVGNLHKNWAKYDSKVASLKASLEKKKTKKDSDIQKVTRNESKLRTARKEYRRNLISLTLLTEEVTERGWKDLIPLMVRMLEFDIETSNESVELMNKLREVQDEMLCLGHRYEMGDEEMHDGRLKTLLENDALEFVRFEDRRDIESLEPSINTATPMLTNSSTSNLSTPSTPSSPTDVRKLEVVESTPTNSESEHLSQEGKPSAPLQPEDSEEQPNEPDSGDKAKPFDEQSVDERGKPVMPTSIYLVYDEDGVQSGIDDMTTLTPYPDRASV